MQHQHTLRDVLEFEGVGLHTGAAVRLTARWQAFGAQDRLAVISGSQGRRHLAAVCPAP